MPRRKTRTDQQIVDACNALARTLYRHMGYVVRDGYKFYEATHPQEVTAWEMAVSAYSHIENTDIENALAELGCYPAATSAASAASAPVA
jgi:hypothetical protein